MTDETGYLEGAITTAILALLAFSVLDGLVPPTVSAGVHSLGIHGWYVTVGTAIAWLSLKAGISIGPLWVSPAELTWKSVSSVLAARRARVLLTGLGASLATGLLVWASDPSDSVVARTALLVAVVAASGWLASFALQHLNSYAVSQAVVLAVAAVTCALLVWRAGDGQTGLALALALAYSALVTAARRGILWISHRRLQADIPAITASAAIARWELSRGSTVIEAVRTSSIAMDATSLVLARERTYRGGRIPLRGLPPAAVVALRCLTAPGTATALPLLVMCHLVQNVWGEHLALLLALAAAYYFSSQAARPLRAMLEAPALARIHLPGRRGLRNPVVMAYLVLIGLFTLLGTAVLDMNLGYWCAIVISATFFVLRRASTDRAGFSAGPLMASPMGPIPIGLFRRRFAGTDVFAVTAWLMLAGANGIVVSAVLAIALIAYVLAFTTQGR